MKTQITLDGKAVEVDVPGVVSEADVASKYMPKEVVEQIIQDRLTQFAKNHVKTDSLDVAAITALAEKKGLKLATSGTQSDDLAKQITQVKGEWTKQELEPVLAREQAFKGEVDTLRRDRLTDAIRAAAARHFKDVLLTPPVPGAKPPIVTMLEPQFGFNEQTRTWHVKSAEGFAISSEPQKYGVYKTPEEAVAEMAKNPAYKDFVRVETQAGPGLASGGAVSGGDGRVVLTPAQASDYGVYAEALKRVGGDASRIVVNDPKMHAYMAGLSQ